MKRKYLAIALIILSVINLICLVVGYISSDSHSFNDSLSPSTEDINISVIILSIIQIVNILLLMIVLKKNKYKKLIFTFVILTAIITTLVPVKIEHGVIYNYEHKNNLKHKNESTTFITTTENLYSITLRKIREYTMPGLVLF